VEALVEAQLLARAQHYRLERGPQIDLHLAALREDVDGAVLVGGQVNTVGRRRRAELVDLFLERRDLLARVGQRLDESLPVRVGLRSMPERRATLRRIVICLVV